MNASLWDGERFVSDDRVARDPAHPVVCLATDRGYVRFLRGTLRALVRRQRAPEQVVIYVLGDGLVRGDIRSLERAAAPADLRYLPIDSHQLSRLRLDPTSHLTRATAARLVLPDIVAEARVIYLDVDVLVRHDLSPLMSVPLQGHPVAAARDPFFAWFGTHAGIAEIAHRYGVDRRKPYFNTGVLVIDRQRWLERELGERAMRLLMDHRLHFLDQDALNLLLVDGWRRLEPRWNLIPESVRPDVGSLLHAAEDPDDIQAASRDPAIVHFAGRQKPWTHAGRYRPYRGEWREAFRESAPVAARWHELGDTAWHYPRGIARRIQVAAQVLRHGA